MKKIFVFFSMLFMLVALNANAEDRIYLKESNVQAGAKGKIDLCIETDKLITSVNCEFTLPEGVEVESWDADIQPTSFNPAINNVLFFNKDAYSTGVIATIVVNVDADVEIGDHIMAVTMAKIVQPDLTTYTLPSVESTLTVQKAAVIDELPEGYALAVKPFVAVEGQNSLDIMFKAPETIKDLSFDLTLPNGMFLYNSDYDSTVPEIVSSVVTAPATGITITPKDEQSVSVKIVGNKLKKTGLVASNELVKAFTLSTYVFSEEEEMGEDYAYESNSIQTIKISNISMSNLDGSQNVSGESLASVIFGQPATTEAILYGNYSSDEASAFSTALKNVAIADVTAATVEDGVKFDDVLVNEKGGNSYYTRTSKNYGTTVLPLDLTTENVAELYKIESMDANSIVIVEAENGVVSANTPCIFKGTINVEGATPTLGVPSDQGLGQTTFKGTYQATEIAAGEGYYISFDGCFYGDGATVRPFRGYFEGTVSGAKLRVLLEDETGVKDITNELSDEAIYTLQGIRVNNAQKGINIKGGKKVYVK